MEASPSNGSPRQGGEGQPANEQVTNCSSCVLPLCSPAAGYTLCTPASQLTFYFNLPQAVHERSA